MLNVEWCWMNNLKHQNTCSCTQNDWSSWNDTENNSSEPLHVGYIIFFPERRTGLFSVKIQKKFLAIKNFSDNQINASFIDISRIKWLVFYCGRLSSAQLVPLQAPKHRPIISPHPVEQTGVPERHQRQWIINPSLQICAWNFNRTGRG